MTLIHAENVNLALPEGARRLHLYGEHRQTRNGKALAMRGPFITVFENPKDRVLFSPLRDCNPFFHLMESLWMLAGRHDVAFPSTFNSNIAQYSDDGIRFSGAYGFRWRKWFDIDQIHAAILRLASDHETRRVVVQMYDARHDIKIEERGGLDIPCNLAITFQVWISEDNPPKLDMTVFNRSNDLIWGAYGANVVHMTMLQQLIAEAIDVEVGEYAQVSANTHAYERHFELLKKLADEEAFTDNPAVNPYGDGSVVSSSLLVKTHAYKETAQMFLDDCQDLCDRVLEIGPISATNRGYQTIFFNNIVVPILQAWRSYKEGDVLRALNQLACIPQKIDWRLACTQWIERRAGRKQ